MNRRLWAVMAIAGLGIAATSFAGPDDKPRAKHMNKPSHGGTMATIEPGKPAPDFTLTGYDGKTFELSKHKNKIVVLEWTNRDCPVCQKYEDDLKQTATKYMGKGIIWWSIDSTSMHDAKGNTEYYTEKKTPYPVLSDFDGHVGHEYGARVTPHVFIINKGTVAYEGAFMSEKKDKNYVAAALDELMAGKSVSHNKTKAFGCSVKYKK
ncbi:MAG: redoxin domain-containing protein [Phycisphaerae bacterium]